MSEPAPETSEGSADFESLFDAAPFGYLILATDGRVARANATLATWLGVGAKSLQGERFRDLLTVPSRIFYETNFAPMLRLEGRFEEVALDMEAASGTLPLLVNAVEDRDANGAPTRVRLGIVRSGARRDYERDLQGRAAVAARLLADEKATSELREQFIAVLGHDLRNPLASMVGAARLLRREGQNEKSLKILELMDASVDRMAGLIDDVMDFARGRLGSGIGLQRQIAPLEPVLHQVVAELEASHPSREIVCEIDAPTPFSFDPGRIAQLVSNLLGNAIAHGDPKAPIRLGAIERPEEVEIWVANGGEPIELAAMERLFQPFFRGEVRGSQQGLGLGLYIASEISTAHNGRLSASSEPSETRFTLTIPRTAPEP